MNTRELVGLIRSQLHGRYFDLYNMTVVASALTKPGLLIEVRSDPLDPKTRELFEISIKKVNRG